MAKAFLDRVSNKAIGQLLIERGFLSPQQCEEALAHARREGLRLGEALVALGWVSRDVLSYALGEQFGLQPVELDPSMIDIALVRRFPLDFLRRHLMLPLIEIGEEIVVVVSDPHDTAGLREFAGFVPAHQVSAQLGDPEQVRRCLEAVEFAARHWSAFDHASVPTDCDLEAVEARPSAGNFVRWLVTASVQHPEADLFVNCSDRRAVVGRRRPGGAAGAPWEPVHEFDAALFGSLRDAIWAQCDPVRPATVPVGMFQSPLRFAGRLYTLQVALLRHISGETIRLRPLAYSGDPTRSAIPDASAGNERRAAPEAPLELVLYESVPVLENWLEDILVQGASDGISLLLQESTRRVFPQAAAWPGLFADPVQAALACGATRVVFDSPVGTGTILRVRGGELPPPGVTVCAPVGAGLSADAVAVLRELKPAVLHLDAQGAAGALTPEAALEKFGGVL